MLNPNATYQTTKKSMNSTYVHQYLPLLTAVDMFDNPAAYHNQLHPYACIILNLGVAVRPSTNNSNMCSP